MSQATSLVVPSGPPPERFPVLRSDRYPAAQRALRALAEALFFRPDRDPAAGAPLQERLDFVQAELTELLHHAGSRSRLMFLLCLFGASWLAPLFIGRIGRLSSLPLPDRIRALSRMEDSQLGAPLILAVKAVMCVVFYEHPDSAREIGAVGLGQDGQGGLPALAAPTGRLPIARGIS